MLHEDPSVESWQREMAGVLDIAATIVQARIRGYLCRKIFSVSAQTVGSSLFASAPTAPTAEPASDLLPEYEPQTSTAHSIADSLNHAEVHSVPHFTDVKSFLRQRLHKRRHSAPSATVPPTTAAAVQQRPQHRSQLWRSPADVLTLCRAAARFVTPAVLLLREGELATVLDALGLQLRTEPAVDQSDRSMPPSIELPLRCAAGAAAAAAAEAMADAVAAACAATGLLQVCVPPQQITTAHGAAVRSALIAMIEGPQGAGGPAEFITTNTGEAAATAAVSDWSAAQVSHCVQRSLVFLDVSM
jgi:IQ calmodulin-binding motif